MDKLTPEQRHKNMVANKSKDSKIELILRKTLWAKGIRYRKNYSKLYGKPDIAITKHKIAIFVDGEFWHGYDWDNRKSNFKSNEDYWIPKIENNIKRDAEVNRVLCNQGWIVIRFWGRQIEKNLESCISEIEALINRKMEV